MSGELRQVATSGGNAGGAGPPDGSGHPAQAPPLGRRGGARGDGGGGAAQPHHRRVRLGGTVAVGICLAATLLLHYRAAGHIISQGGGDLRTSEPAGSTVASAGQQQQRHPHLLHHQQPSRGGGAGLQLQRNQNRSRNQQQEQQQQQRQDEGGNAPALTRPECPAGATERSGKGCGTGCREHGMHTCCTRSQAGLSERGFYDDVPFPVGFDGGEAPLATPRHDTTPIRPGGGGGAGGSSSSSAAGPPPLRCWGPFGDPLPKLPSWLPTLWGALHADGGVPLLRGLAERLAEGRGGSAFTVWVAAKFMPPQKEGRNVRGDAVDAPTRGRDNAYYLKEYGSVYSTSFPGPGKAVYNAQLVSKKALVVCMWERLHVNLFNCSVGSTGVSFPIHFCQCRHCHDQMVQADGGASAGRGAPAPSTELKDSGGGVKWVPYAAAGSARAGGVAGGACVDAASAPWLLPRSKETGETIFPYEGLHLDLGRLLEVQADRNKVVVVFIFNRFWVDHLHNVVHSMARFTGMRNYIVATLDCESLELCLKNRLPCFNAERFAETEADMKEGAKGFQKGFQRKVTEELSWIKPRLALKVMSLGFHFLMADMDMSFHADPMQNVVTRGHDFTHQCDTPTKYSINTGFYLLKSNLRAQRLFENIMVFPPHRLSDQNALKLVAKYDHTHGASSGCLDRWAYNMKCNYKVPKSEKHVGGARTFQWKPQQKDRSKFDWYIFHATCLDGAIAKINWLRASNAWFLDDLDAVTKKPYCMVYESPDGTVRRFDNLTRRTLHSAKYPTELDPQYSQERH